MKPPGRWTKRVAFAAFVLLVVSLSVVASGLGLRWFGPSVVNNAVGLIGRTEQQVRLEYGEPQKESPGYEPLGLMIPPRLPAGPIKTLIFKPHGLLHLEHGWLWVWFTLRGDEWVCFESCWYADNVQF